MRWAVEIQETSLEQRNLTDLLSKLGFSIVDGIEFRALASPAMDSLQTSSEVWSEAKRLRYAIAGPANIDSAFRLGAVIDYTTTPPKRDYFLEVDSVLMNMNTFFPPTVTVSPAAGLSEQELAAWHAAQAEQQYQQKLRSQLEKIVPVFREPRASKVLELLNLEHHTGETLYKIYELAEGNPSNRRAFQSLMGITADQFRRFGDAVHNSVVSGDLARHAYTEAPKSSNPMTLGEAEGFARQVTKQWLASIR